MFLSERVRDDPVDLGHESDFFKAMLTRGLRGVGAGVFLHRKDSRRSEARALLRRFERIGAQSFEQECPWIGVHATIALPDRVAHAEGQVMRRDVAEVMHI